MPTDITKKRYMLGLLDDEFISFNFRRSSRSHSSFPRKVILLSAPQLKKTIIPGLKEKAEPILKKELKKYQNWKAAKNFSFEIDHYFYSFLWRFRMDQNFVLNEIHALNALKNKEAKKVKLAFKKYQASLRSNLVAGQVYLFPDADVIFQRPNRFKQVYARRVLVINVRSGQLVIIPFSSRVDRINEKTDILFDPDFKRARLDPHAMPAVENFPYKIFFRKVALFVCAAQPITEKDFLEAALIAKGAIRKDVLDFVREKMKNI